MLLRVEGLGRVLTPSRDAGIKRLIIKIGGGKLKHLLQVVFLKLGELAK